ncbi:hypothetical protein BATDEDRAFT_24998 [Batrachochytrium dendrobatidis JAM81]|uniref:Centromere protein S n=1 Tax=Batrachochytrium dendrobatidis (strain JAM81 / FGSC 10211) TaxID=684364 RepID=F4P3E2_BATDJ|nr:uncharacterized protein BATDEDRAFT_24998 [Batrachochytrium dendrobatidis JAM81]EGF80430.1 hypothetical protein BATDEDRAFT_24998 [Batrachochytrium dendrobatidis JAM81]|eukprot:XP_006678982.1 hypothetical protein BATDEDRAFT_24998 [Batrachochytrium dendrobatidis JAM81]
MAEHDDNIDACSQDPIDDIQDQLSEPIEGEEMQVQRVLIRKAIMDAISRDHPKIQVTPEFVYALGEVVVRHAELMGADLESFAKHAKRSVISVDDVKLFARRNIGLQEKIRNAEAAGGGQKRKHKS